MIYLHNDPNSVFTIDSDLVVDYKVICDRYLVNIHRNLTRQLVFYKLYRDLQNMNNSYYKVIYKLLNDKYESLEAFKKDNSEFIKSCDVFIKNSNNVVPEHIYKIICNEIDKLKLAMNKLVYIAEEICYSEEN